MSAPDLTWKDGVPHSVLFDDKYFCKDNGYEDTMAVACGGNRLAERFARLDPHEAGTFVLIETGFGSGLNFCCAWKIWEETAPASWAMHFISLDKYPMSVEQMDRTLARWPLIERCKIALAAAYAPGLAGDVMVARFAEGRVRLTLVVDEVVTALETIRARRLAEHPADAVFFHGFAPSKNPAMWTEEVFAAMAKLCGPQTTYATFTVAGWVRRGLQAQGFTANIEKGYGQKKHMLTGEYMRKNLLLLFMTACAMLLSTTAAPAGTSGGTAPKLVMHDPPRHADDDSGVQKVELVSLDESENTAKSYYFKGNAYHTQGRFEDAIAAYTEALRLVPNNGNIYGNRGHAYMKLNRVEEALADYSKAIELDPQNGLNYGNRANLHMMRQEYQQAVEDYSMEVTLNSDPDHSSSYNGRAAAYYFLGKYAEGLSDARKAQELGLPIDDNLIQALQEKAGQPTPNNP